MTVAGKIEARAELWREGGEWMLLVSAPYWVVSDFAAAARGGRISLASMGGRAPLLQDAHASFLLETRDVG